MKNNKLTIWLLFFFFLHIRCESQIQNINSSIGRHDRTPAVAGSFYPSDKTELITELQNYFAHAIKPSNKFVNAIIAPHAGYIYSGQVAASAYNQIDTTQHFETIFIIGSSHILYYDGVSIYNKGNFITPLGTVPVDIPLATKIIKSSNIFDTTVDAHSADHCIEVQLPFLQYKFNYPFKIVPIIIGGDNKEICSKLAKILKPYFTTKKLFVISSDFSHYPSYNDAIAVDKNTASAILTNNPDKLIKTLKQNAQKGVPALQTSLCGWTSVLTMLYLTENIKNVAYHLVDYKNSGDVAAGDKNRVVGYNAISITMETSDKQEFVLTQTDKTTLLDIARKTIVEYITNRSEPKFDSTKFSASVLTPCGAFVTLNKDGQLRGCIGRFSSTEPLYKVIQEMAIASSTQDTRFSKVTSTEIPNLEIEISVLTPMRKIQSIDEIVLGKHGIYIKKGYYSGTFLPQVATETGWSKEEFLGHCSRDKAGLSWDSWKTADIYVYEANVFSEKEFKK